MIATDVLIADLRVLTTEFDTILNEEGNAIRAAKFAHALGLQDRKIGLHTRLSTLLENVKVAKKTEEQREEIRGLLLQLTGTAHTNKSAIESGFSAIDRLVGRMFSTMRRAVQKETPRYNAGGAYHTNARSTLNLQTDQTA